MQALNRGYYVTAVLAAIGFVVATLLAARSSRATRTPGGTSPSRA